MGVGIKMGAVVDDVKSIEHGQRGQCQWSQVLSPVAVASVGR